MGYKLEGVSCSGRDSDWDGYVSCSVNAVGHEPVSVECGYGRYNGCKMVDNIKNRRR